MLLLPNIRYQCKGRRQLACLSLDSVKMLTELLGIDLTAGDMLASIKRAFESMDDDTFDKYCAKNPKIYRVVIEPGSVIYIPFGHFVFEQVIGEELVFGFRTACFNSCFTDMFAHMVELYGKSQSPEVTLVKFWVSLLSLLMTKPEHDSLRENLSLTE